MRREYRTYLGVKSFCTRRGQQLDVHYAVFPEERLLRKRGPTFCIATCREQQDGGVVLSPPLCRKGGDCQGIQGKNGESIIVGKSKVGQILAELKKDEFEGRIISSKRCQRGKRGFLMITSPVRTENGPVRFASCSFKRPANKCASTDGTGSCQEKQEIGGETIVVLSPRKFEKLEEKDRKRRRKQTRGIKE